MPWRARVVLFMIAVAALVGDPAAQAPPPAAQPPVFRSGVEVVRLDVRVTDADGLPIGDLRRDEIEIVEGGVTRPVLLFQHIAQPLGTYADAAQRTIAAEVSTNQGAPRGQVYALVFDQAHIRPAAEQKARLAAQRFLRSSMRPGDRVALHLLPGPGPSIEFTTNTARVSRQLALVQGGRNDSAVGVPPIRVYDAYQITRGNQDVLTRYVQEYASSPASTDARTRLDRGVAGASGEELPIQRRLVLEDARTVVARADEEARQFLTRLTDLVRTLREIEGRKAVVLFSEGFEIDNVRRELEEVVAAAAQSYCVVYALDLNSRAVGLDEATPRGGAQYSEIQSRLESLGSLTAETDGVLFNDATSQLDRVFARIASASQDYYLVGFAPAEAAVKDRDRYQRIRVVVKRPGVRVNVRTGYALGPGPTPADRRRAVEAALRAPFSQQGLRVEYTTYVMRASGAAAQRVILSLAAELPVADAEHHPADVVFAVRAVESGRLVASGGDDLALPLASRPGATTGTGYYRAQFTVPPGVYVMRAVVREPGGLLGSADRRFRVRNLTGPGVTAGDLLIGSSGVEGLPVRAAVYPSEMISGVFEAYARLREPLDTLKVVVELLPFGKTAALTTGRGDLGAINGGAGGFSREVRVEIPTQGLPPGEYLVRVAVRSGRETVAELMRDITVTGDPRPVATPGGSGDLPDAGVAAVLTGDVVRQFVGRVRERTAGQALAKAAALAAEARWSAIDAALPPGTSSSPEGSALAGLARFAGRDYRGAAEAWRAALDAEPASAATAFLLGWAYAASGDDRAAVSAWRVAIGADATLVPAYLALVEAYLRLAQPDLALQVARSGVAALPLSPELRDRLQRLERR